MKAVVQLAYGSTDVLELRDIEVPVAKDDEVLIQVRAASVHADVWHVMTGLPYVLRLMGAGLRRPRNPVPGTDVAGIVVSVGGKVTRFRPGDEVFGETIRGNQWTNGGAYAEYATAPEHALASKPPEVTFEQAAAVPTAALIALPALSGLRGAQAERKVLVNGAGGGVGAIAVQIAKAFGAHVTGVDGTEKMELMRATGADRVIDYTEEDFTRRGERYDLIFDIPGNHSFSDCRRALVPGGSYVLIGHENYGRGMRRWVGVLPRMFKLMAMSLFVRELRGMRSATSDRREAMDLVEGLLRSGELTPHIDKTYPLSGVPEAIRYLQEGRARGRIVISV